MPFQQGKVEVERSFCEFVFRQMTSVIEVVAHFVVLEVVARKSHDQFGM